MCKCAWNSHSGGRRRTGVNMPERVRVVEKVVAQIDFGVNMPGRVMK